MAVKKAIREVDSRLRDYELVVIVSPEITAEKLDGTIDTISGYITGKNGVISEVEKWGKKKLAYPIKNFDEGNYVLFKFQFAPSLGKDLESSLRISEDIVRHLLTKQI